VTVVKTAQSAGAVLVSKYCSFIMAALCSRCGHDIFALWFLLLLLSIFLAYNLSRRRLDVCHPFTHGVALVRISDADL